MDNHSFLIMPLTFRSRMKLVGNFLDCAICILLDGKIILTIESEDIQGSNVLPQQFGRLSPENSEGPETSNEATDLSKPNT